MAISEAFNGSASISTTEYFLASNSTTATYQTGDGVYQLFLDLNALAAGDIYELKCYEKTRSASTARVVFSETIRGPLASPVLATPSLLLLHGWEFSLDKIAGTDRTIEWSIRQVA